MNKAYREQEGYRLGDRESTGLSTFEEKFIETAYCLTADIIRVNNLSAHLNKPTKEISKTAKALADRGLAKFERYGAIRLTDEGKRIAAFILWRRETVNKLFKYIDGNDICKTSTDKIDSYLSPNAVRNIEKFLSTLDTDIF